MVEFTLPNLTVDTWRCLYCQEKETGIPQAPITL